MPFYGGSPLWFHAILCAAATASSAAASCDMVPPSQSSSVLLQLRSSQNVIQCRHQIRDGVPHSEGLWATKGIGNWMMRKRLKMAEKKLHRFRFASLPSAPASLATLLPCALCGAPAGRGLATVRYYSAPRDDGFGEQLGSLLFHMATAQSLGLAFGGLITRRTSEWKGEMSTVLGMDYDSLVINMSNPTFDRCFLSEHPNNCNRAAMKLAKATFSDEQSVFVECMPLVELVEWGPTLLTPQFLSSFRSLSKIWSIPARRFDFTEHPAVPSLHVAMHVRRGDVLFGNRTKKMLPPERRIMQTRFVDDDQYLEVAHHIQKFLPKAQIHVFSTTGEQWNSSSFDVFRRKGFHVHLDGEEMDDLAHLAKSDLLVSAPSSFSFIARLLNPNCVVTLSCSRSSCSDGFDKGPGLPEWIHRGDDEEDFQQRLQSCIRKHPNRL